MVPVGFAAAAFLVGIGIWIGVWIGAERSLSEGEAPLIGLASLSGESYLSAIRDAGGVPVVLPNGEGSENLVDDYLDRLDGLVLPGGLDIPPAEYGEEAHETVEPLGPDRHRFEKALVEAWIHRTEKPLLGICLGGQWINVASGGSLVQDIPTEFGISHRDREHPVSLATGSRLAAIFDVDALSVNSSHHQAVKRLGRGLRVVARCPDGVIEAIEGTDRDRFLVGVQWHPERHREADPRQDRLFRAFVDAARQARVER